MAMEVTDMLMEK